MVLPIEKRRLIGRLHDKLDYSGSLVSVLINNTVYSDSG